MLTIPDLNRMRVFHLVYQKASIIGAARALNVTRSAVSQNLKALEGEIHATLFVRDSKKVTPTPAAEALFKLMNPFLLDLETTLNQMEIGRAYPTGHLRIGAPLDFGSHHLTEIVGRFREKNPLVTFELLLAVPMRQLELLAAGKIDFAFIDNGDFFLKDYPISCETVLEEKFVLAANNDFYRKHIGVRRSRNELQSLPIVDYLPHAPVARMWFRHHFGKTISELKVVYSAESVRAVLQALRSGIGVGVIPAQFLKGSTGDLKEIKMPKSPLINRISLALNLSKKLTLTEKAFMSFYKNQRSEKIVRA